MEEILVCLSGAPSNVRVIKAAAKMAEAYGGNLTALYVEPPDFHEHDPEQSTGSRKTSGLPTG